MNNFGFSTGCLFHQNHNVYSSIEMYHSFGLKNIELSFANLWELEDFNMDKFILDKLNDFKFISVHAPFIKIEYSNNNFTNSLLNKLKELKNNFNITTFVFHPNTIKNFKIFENHKMNISIENMDIRKKIGISIHEFREYVKYEYLNFIFDIQHAYEHDNLENQSYELFDLIKDKIHHIHLSGNTIDSIHSLLFNSNNQNEILSFIFKNKILNYPIILEGSIKSNCEKEIKEEINYISSLKKYKTSI